MRQCRIQLSGGLASLLIVLLSGASLLAPSRLRAQTCAGTLGSYTYDTAFTAHPSTLQGSMSNTFDYYVPQFPISTLTLYAVTVQSTITIQSDLTITNVSGSTASGNVRFYRSDDVSSTPTGDINNGVITGAFIVSNLGSGASQTFPNKTILTNNQILYDSITGGSLNATAYQGSGSIDFTYNENSSALVTGPFTIVSENYTDIVNFSVTYYYCNPGSLATDLLTFNAVKQNDNTVLLAWNTTNEQAGRKYVVEVSKDGTTFEDYTSLASDPLNSNASYHYSYPLDPNASGKLYFRLRIIDEIGPIHYSIVAIVDLDRGANTGNHFYVYPNPPTDFINLNIPGTNPLSWQVDIIAADGSLVQRNITSGTTNPRINFARKLASGTYFVRAVNTQNATQYTSSFVIR